MLVFISPIVECLSASFSQGLPRSYENGPSFSFFPLCCKKVRERKRTPSGSVFAFLLLEAKGLSSPAKKPFL